MNIKLGLADCLIYLFQKFCGGRNYRRLLINPAECPLQSESDRNAASPRNDATCQISDIAGALHIRVIRKIDWKLCLPKFKNWRITRYWGCRIKPASMPIIF